MDTLNAHTDSCHFRTWPPFSP